MHAHDIAFAEGSDFDLIFLLTTRFADYSLDGDRRARRRIFLVHVMPLENLSGIIVLQSCGGRARQRREKDSLPRRSLQRKRILSRWLSTNFRIRSISPCQPVVPTTMFLPAGTQASIWPQRK